MDRSQQPTYKAVESIRFVKPEEHKVGGHFSLYHLKEVPNETCRIDLYFDAGKCFGHRGIPSFVNGLLLSGTAQMSSHEIEEAINSRGGFFSSGVSLENATVTIHCLREKAVELVEIVAKAIQDVSFIEKEVNEYLADQKQKYLIGLEKVGFLAQKMFQEKMFSSEAMYCETIQLEDFANISINDLKKFHQEKYRNGLTKLAIVGNLSNSDLDAILGIVKPMISNDQVDYATKIQNEAGLFYVPKENALQSAIRMGVQLFNKQHEDYLDFLVLNTILGDYFGSRLMRNIREDKGYTYGIGSAVVELSKTGYFVIGTEVGKDVREAALSEIKKEIKLLQDQPVTDHEIELVQNYMLGQLLKSADGPYAMMDLFLSANINGMNLNVYNNAIDKVKNITPARIQELTNKYLNWNDLSIISVG